MTSDTTKNLNIRITKDFYTGNTSNSTATYESKAFIKDLSANISARKGSERMSFN
jgi:hypothetical protein